MALIPYEPFRQIDHWRNEMNRFFNEMFPATFTQGFVGPRIDVYETEDEVIASCEVPGLESKDDIKIDVNENMLTISGRINRANEIREELIHRRERYMGAFQRSVALPSKVQAEGIRATYRNGILEVHMPKAKTDAKRRIEVEFH